MAKLRPRTTIRPPVRREARIDAILNSERVAPEEPFYSHDDLSRVIRQLAAEGRTDADIAARTGMRSVDRVRELREHLGCAPDPENEGIWDGLAGDEPPEAA